MEEPRAPKHQEMSQVLDFLNRSLRPQSNWSIAQEYPTAFSSTNLHNLRILTDSEQKILSHALLKPLIIKTPLLLYKVAAIGSVVTDENYRGQGLSSAVLESCLQEARKQQCDFAVLWTSLHDFYRKKGFELAGFEESLRISEETFENLPPSDLQFQNKAQVSPEAILRLANAHSVMSVRTHEDVRKFLQIPKTEVFTAWAPTGELKSFAIVGKGADLTDYVHEWGGSVTHLFSLLAHICKSQKRTLTLLAPAHSVNLISQLQQRNADHHTGYLGMIKILEPQSFFAKVIKAARSIGLADLVLTQNENSFLVGFGADTRRIESELDLVRVLFGPVPSLGWTPETQKKIDRLFPLPLWFWGWDSM